MDGYVRYTLPFPLDCCSHRALWEFYAHLITKTYRGACTVKDWSNTTACPSEWCNDSKDPFCGPFKSLFPPPIYIPYVVTTAYSLSSLIPVVTSSWANLWMCPPNTPGIGQWWCGVDEDQNACQSGDGGHFGTYPSGSILGFPPITSSSSLATITSSLLSTTTIFAGLCSEATTVPVSSPAKASTDHTLSAQTQGYSTSLAIDVSAPSDDQNCLASPSTTAGVALAQSVGSSTKLPTTIGVAVGIPLGMFVIGFLALSFWKERTRRYRSDKRIVSPETVSKKDDQPVGAAAKSPWIELADNPLPRELGDTGKRELPSI